MPAAAVAAATAVQMRLLAACMAPAMLQQCYVLAHTLSSAWVCSVVLQHTQVLRSHQGVTVGVTAGNCHAWRRAYMSCRAACILAVVPASFLKLVASLVQLALWIEGHYSVSVACRMAP